MAVATLVGGAFLSASLQVLFDRLASREVVNLFRKQTSNVHELLKKLKRKLVLLNGVLDDADFKQFTDKTVKAWSDEARDAIYQADDLLGEIAYEAFRCKAEANIHCQSGTSQVTYLISSSSTSLDEEIEPKLEKIIQLLDDLIKDADFLGLKKGVQHVNTPTRCTSSVVVVSDVYGRNSEKEKLMKLLLPDETSSTNNKVGVIPLVGMGGLGKTTLARLAYNDDRVDMHFNMKAWVCVSEEFDVLKVTKTILESVTKCICNSTNLNQVQESLKQKLSGTKFLIVLDDVWNENYNHWDILRTPFRTGAYGSKIIVTTRIQSVAAIMATGPILDLPGLSHDNCWLLFAKIAFAERDPSNYPLLEEIGRKIVKRCRGLPLAVKSLAGLLRSKFDVEEWDDILKSKFWDLPEDKSDILPALRLSYHYLPSHLKQCFAFCSLFPKNNQFKEDEIVSLWIAQKFMLRQEGKSYEMEGKKCFRELLSMSFFQRGSSELSMPFFHRGSGSLSLPFFQRYDGSDRIESFVMHDLIHDLSQVVAGQFSFRLDADKPHEIPAKARHFSYCADWIDGFRQLHDAKEVNGLRTFLPIGATVTRSPGVEFHDVLSSQKHLRVLSLRDYRIYELPDLIGNLIHLHYLDLSHTYIEHLPESICRLYNLETLLLLGCRRLTTLPVEIGKLFSLRRLDVMHTELREMPMQMRLLDRLEYLPKFVVGKCNGLGIDGLKALSSLRGTLQISGLENVRDSKDSLEAKLKDKEHLERLALEWDGSTNDSLCEREVLDYLQPHANLKNLTIRNYGGTRFSNWLGDHLFSQMVSLRLYNCNHCFCLPPLGQLPCLKELTVEGMSSVIEVGQEFCGSRARNKPFPSLEVLRFKYMLEWVEWRLLGIGEFPKLRELEMIDCPKLVGGLPENIDSIVIQGCSSLESSVPGLSSSTAATYGRKLVLSGSKEVELNWKGMSDLAKLEISDLSSLQNLTSELTTLTKLKDLKFHACSNLLTLSNTGLPPMLTRLSISKCDLLQTVVDGMVSHDTSSLRYLTIRSCPSVVSFAANGLPTSLRSIKLDMCPKLEFPLFEDTESCSSVEELELYGSVALNPLTLLNLFPNLGALNIGGNVNLSILSGQGCADVSCFPQQVLANLTSITIHNCTDLKSLPEGMMYDLLPSLRRMEFRDCRNIESFGPAGLPSSLRHLIISRCEKLVTNRSLWGLQRLPSLKGLEIEGVNDEFVESFPEEGLLPSTLTRLEMYDFPYLKTLNWRGFRHLSSLRTLRIWRCYQLQSLPEEGLPPSVSSLDISVCSILIPRCKENRGDDWSKIAHIPFIKLDREVISSRPRPQC